MHKILCLDDDPITQKFVKLSLEPEFKVVSCGSLKEATLDHYDILIESLLERATKITKRLEQQGKFIESKEDLMKFVGMCLSAKQELISNLYIVDSPDETWDSPDLDKLFHEIKSIFEIDIRYRALEYKSRIIQESIEVITDLIQSKREFILEMTVIALIAFEILMSLGSYFFK